MAQKPICEACFIVSDTKEAREAADRLRMAWLGFGGGTHAHDLLFGRGFSGRWNHAPSGQELYRRVDAHAQDRAMLLDDHRIDAVFVIGGDGSLLEAVRTCHSSGFDVPLIGWNTGHVGFWMHDIPVSDLELEAQLRTFLDGAYDTIELPLLTVKLTGSGGSETIAHAFNEVTVRRADQAVRLELTVDEERLGTMTGDGILISSPQGTTAYNVNAGGPAVDMFLPSLTVNPLIPSLLAGNTQLRFPLVLAPTRTFAIEVCERGKRPAVVESDNVRYADVVRLEVSIDFRAESVPPVRLLYPKWFGGARRFPRRVREKLLGG